MSEALITDENSIQFALEVVEPSVTTLREWKEKYPVAFDAMNVPYDEQFAQVNYNKLLLDFTRSALNGQYPATDIKSWVQSKLNFVVWTNGPENPVATLKACIQSSKFSGTQSISRYTDALSWVEDLDMLATPHPVGDTNALVIPCNRDILQYHALHGGIHGQGGWVEFRTRKPDGKLHVEAYNEGKRVYDYSHY